MGTTIRPVTTKKNPYWIERQRYHELKHFCLQYQSWKEKLYSLDSMVQAQLNGAPPQDTGEHSDPTVDCVALRAQYRRKIEMLGEVADATDSELGNYILTGIVLGIPYDIVKQKTDVPCCKDVYYNLYRKFFWLLDQRRDEYLV